MNWESLALTDQHSAFGKVTTCVYANGSAELFSMNPETGEQRILECARMPIPLPRLSGPFPRHYGEAPPLTTTFRLVVGYPGSFHVSDWNSEYPSTGAADLRRYLDLVREHIVRLNGVDSPGWQHAFKDVVCNSTVPMLNERVLIDLPDDAQVQPSVPQVGGIMGYRRTHPWSHGALFRVGNHHVSLLAEDLGLVDDGNLRKYVETTVALQNPGSAEVQEIVPGRHLLLTAHEPPRQDGVCNVCTSYYLHPDGSILTFTGKIDADLLDHVGYRAVVDLFRRVFATARPGSRELVQGPRAWRVPLESGSKSHLSCQLPPKVIVRVDEGPDYYVYRFYRRPTFFGADDLALSLYLGRHPSPSLPATETTEEIAFLDASFPWFVQDQRLRLNEVLFRREVFVGLGDGDDGPYYLHAELAYKTWEERATLHFLLTSMKLEERSSPPPSASNDGAYPSCSVEGFLASSSPFRGGTLRLRQGPSIESSDVLVELLSSYELHEWNANLPFEAPLELTPTTSPQIFRVGKLLGSQLLVDTATHHLMRVDPASGLPRKLGMRSDHFLDFLWLYPMLNALLGLPPELRESRLAKTRTVFEQKIPAEAFEKLRELYPRFMNEVLGPS